MNKSKEGHFKLFLAYTMVVQAVLQGICSGVSSLPRFTVCDGALPSIIWNEL